MVKKWRGRDNLWFTPTSGPDGVGHVIRFYEIECRDCGATARYHRSGMNAEGLRKIFQRQGWEIGSTKKNHRCPQCLTKKPSGPVIFVNGAGNASTTMPPVTNREEIDAWLAAKKAEAPPPRELTALERLEQAWVDCSDEEREQFASAWMAEYVPQPAKAIDPVTRDRDEMAAHLAKTREPKPEPEPEPKIEVTEEKPELETTDDTPEDWWIKMSEENP